ncbi:hypothetical protein [Hyphomicrobium sp.]|uniref:hypothetical protein n=1 Tax=Hyphomicrobium sp. TaxID=82 RepID=UPI001D9E47F0|nr:hypothetical protein [Hyphomicrobium sp.]MBY0561416.1 hypothetical protein [Hyphomicrobium sp.]
MLKPENYERAGELIRRRKELAYVLDMISSNRPHPAYVHIVCAGVGYYRERGPAFDEYLALLKADYENVLQELRDIGVEVTEEAA